MTVRRVLIVDDNEDHRFLTARSLRRAAGDIEVQTEAVASAEEALDYLQRRGRFAGKPRPHLVILDLRMPRMSGTELLELVKRDPELRTIPIVALSSSDRTEDIDAVFRLGGNSYVIKQTSRRGLGEALSTIADYWTRESSLPRPPD
ncbi:MAG TPA: response regulator [Nitriliruptorales bacterium]|nr:response regulator [Nitriliruptorales bacterium]